MRHEANLPRATSFSPRTPRKQFSCSALSRFARLERFGGRFFPRIWTGDEQELQPLRTVHDIFPLRNASAAKAYSIGSDAIVTFSVPDRECFSFRTVEEYNWTQEWRATGVPDTSPAGYLVRLQIHAANKHGRRSWIFCTPPSRIAGLTRGKPTQRRKEVDDGGEQ